MSEVKQRLTTEKTINHDFFRLKFGTVNRINPPVVYLDGRTFISPIEDMESYNYIIQKIRKSFSTTIGYEVAGNELFDSRYILDFQVANSGVRVGKKSFLSFQLMLKQKGNNVKTFKEIKKLSEKQLITVVDKMVKDISNDFIISKTKKESIYTKVNV